jgi:Enoyl-CoA hydratase/isomerase
MIDVKTEDGIATVTMRHGKANALDITLCEGLADCFDKLRASDARAVVLTGQGHIFSAGVDLLQVSAGGADYLRRFLPMLNRMYEAVFFHPKPLVAATTAMPFAGGSTFRRAAEFGRYRSNSGLTVVGAGPHSNSRRSQQLRANDRAIKQQWPRASRPAGPEGLLSLASGADIELLVGKERPLRTSC